MNYRNELDGLRAVAVGLVMLAHAGVKSLQGGFVGVDIFFVLSGYLITTIIYREQIDSRFSLLKFYERRIRRILPALFFVLIVCIPFAYFLLLPAENVDFSRGSLSVVLFVSNIYYMFRGGYFRHELEENLLLHTWSLAVEEQFYIFFPLLIMIVFFVAKKRTKLVLHVALVAAFIGSIVLAEWGWRGHPQASFYATPMRAWELLAGSICALYLYGKKTTTGNSYLASIGLVLILFSAVTFSSKTPTPSLYTLIPILGSVLVILYGDRDKLAQVFLTNKAVVVVGAISYSAYLWHQPVYALARVTDHFYGVKIVFFIFLTLLLAWLTWKYIENPFRQRDRISIKKTLLILLTGLLAIIVPALASIKSNGFVSQYPIHDRKMVSMNMVDFGAYVRSRFNEYHLKPFDGSSKSSLLIIGDSYAKDFLNTLVESGSDSKYNIATFEMRPGCGNLFSDRDFKQHLAFRIASICEQRGWYDNPQLLKQIAEADHIVLASNWSSWEADYIGESVENIEKITDGRVYVLGVKDFGVIDLRSYLKIAGDMRASYRQVASRDKREINTAFKQTLSKDTYIDLQSYICNSDAECRLFTDSGELMSMDGTHLTKDGAKFVGKLLFPETKTDGVFKP